jgi:hypothetical protein
LLRKRLLRRGLVPAVVVADVVPEAAAQAALQSLRRLPSAPVAALARRVIRTLALAGMRRIIGIPAAIGCLFVAIAMAAPPTEPVTAADRTGHGEKVSRTGSSQFGADQAG